jgi:predicted metal-dependent enzyme (double-stranded beta helix superfamily)
MMPTTTAPQPLPGNGESAARGPVPPALKRFIWDLQSLVELAESEREILLIGRDLMARLVAEDDWLPPVFAIAPAAAGQPFQLYRDGLERFTVVGTVLPAGASLPVLEQPLWELTGVLRGRLTRQEFVFTDDGDVRSDGAVRSLGRGAVAALPSGPGRAVQIANPSVGQSAVAIQVYGGEIGALRRRLAADGRLHEHISGYANPAAAPPYDIWSIQTEIRD